MTNALAYYHKELNTAVKGFMVQAPAVLVIFLATYKGQINKNYLYKKTVSLMAEAHIRTKLQNFVNNYSLVTLSRVVFKSFCTKTT
jgi:hypothetical protein